MRPLISILLTLIGFGVFGQQASIALNRNAFRIGEQATLSLTFEYPNPNGNALVIWPTYEDEISKSVEIVKKTIDTDQLIDSASGIYQRKQNFTITAFEEGNYTIDPLEIRLGDSTYFTNSAQIQVTTVEIDTSKSIYDIKPIYSVNYPFSERSKDWLKENWYWLAIIGVLILAFFIWRYYNARRKIEPEPEPEVIIPAHIIALGILEKLLKNEEWKSAAKKEYYSEMTDTVRTYLENRFGIHAMEQTTREIINDLKHATISEEDKLYLRKILREADMVKFAKFTPGDEDALTYLNNSIDFVKRTKSNESEKNGN